MKHAAKIPVEPLSEKRWDAIERGVLDRLDAPAEAKPVRERGRAPFVVLGIAATLAAAGLVFAMQPAASPEDVLVVVMGLASTRVATDFASVDTNLGEVGVTLGASSELTAVGSDVEGWFVVFECGTATFEVPPRRERPALVVQVGATRIEVVGTRFTVTRREHVSVEVDHGRVRVLDGAEEWIVDEGERWPAEVVSTVSTSTSTSPSLSLSLSFSFLSLFSLLPSPSPSPSISPLFLVLLLFLFISCECFE